MRIIGGKYKSRKIKYLKNDEIRPTSDNVREAVFNMLEDVSNLKVLDLFAGSGSYGIEALSRGASRIHFNDINRKAVSIITENISLLAENKKVIITNLDYNKALSKYLKEGLKFDLIFIDPPYYQGIYEQILDLILPFLNTAGKIVVEVDKSLKIENLAKFQITKDKTYGKKRIIIINN